jgi:hypothetical protein
MKLLNIVVEKENKMFLTSNLNEYIA